MNETKISPCPMPGCGSECRVGTITIFRNGKPLKVIYCYGCEYRSNAHSHESDAIAAHNDLCALKTEREVMGQVKYCDWCKDQAQHITRRRLNHNYADVEICDPCWATYNAHMKEAIESRQSGPGHFVFVTLKADALTEDKE